MVFKAGGLRGICHGGSLRWVGGLRLKFPQKKGRNTRQPFENIIQLRHWCASKCWHVNEFVEYFFTDLP